MSWTNNNPRVSNISSLVTCNSHVSANVMAGSDDGCVRVWSQDRRQVTGWVVMPELVPLSLSGPRVSCGLQMAWSQHNMSLITGGDSRVSGREKYAEENVYKLYFRTSEYGTVTVR